MSKNHSGNLRIQVIQFSDQQKKHQKTKKQKTG